MTTLHIFNPEHDLALASGLSNYTAPHAGRQLRYDLGWIPALWAQQGDYILVDDQDIATKAVEKLQKKLALPNVNFITQNAHPIHPDVLSPWGWDAAIRARMQRLLPNSPLLPSDAQIDHIRQLSHRSTSALLLKQLHATLHHSALVGEAMECHTASEVTTAISQWKKVVIKAPWSSSGRGIRFVDQVLTPSAEGWLQNTLSQQGSVMVEPYYNKVKDFGMEFAADGNGHIEYLGLSLFHTRNGAYTGNLLATEAYKRQELGRYLSIDLLNEVQQCICQQLAGILQSYQGMFGIDMMIVGTEANDKQAYLHPCVEINLRRTMGHVALALTPLVNLQADNEIVRVMRIEYEANQYKLKIQRP